jgi:putative sterol carrier protein
MCAGVAGEPVAKPDSSPEVQRLLFDVIARSAHRDAVNGSPATIQWHFDDASPWYLRIDNGSSEAVQGKAPDPDITLETSWRDWIDLSIRGADPRVAMLQRKLRPRGSLRMLWRMQRIFPRAG